MILLYHFKIENIFETGQPCLLSEKEMFENMIMILECVECQQQQQISQCSINTPCYHIGISNFYECFEVFHECFCKVTKSYVNQTDQKAQYFKIISPIILSS